MTTSSANHLSRLRSGNWRYPFLAALTLVAFGRIVTHDFVIYDDRAYVTENPIVRDGVSTTGLWWAFTEAHSANWHPLTWMSHMVDCSIYGLNPAGHHATSLALHTVNALLLLYFLSSTTRSPNASLIAACLFAVHPLRAESVAWVAERKDVLCGFFFLLTLLAHARYAAKPSISRMALTFLLLAAGLLSKPMLVTTPFVLLLLDVWPLRRLSWKPMEWTKAAWLVFEKTPLFALSMAAAVAAYMVQHSFQAVASTTQFSAGVRLAVAVTSCVQYIGMTLWPANLAVIYPHPGNHASMLLAVGCAAVVLVLTCYAWVRRAKQPYLLVGWLWYLGMLVPVLGLVQVGSQALADRYTYLPTIGLVVAFVWTGSALSCRSTRLRTALYAVTVSAIGVYAVSAWHQAGFWRNSITLFERAVAVTQFNGVARNNLGLAYLEAGRFDDAEMQFRAIVDAVTSDVPARNNLATALLNQGELAEAEQICRSILSDEPHDINAMNNLGAALLMAGRNAEAESIFTILLEQNSEDPATQLNLAIALANQGKSNEARLHALEALRIDPGFENATQFIAQVLDQSGETGG